MANCPYCNAELRKGKADFILDPKNKQRRFCSQEHLDLWYQSKEVKEKSSKPKSDYKQLTDYINSIWPEMVNWGWFAPQIKSIVKDTGLDYKQIRLTIKYCVDYLDMLPNPQFGLGQYVPKYTQEAMDFADSIISAREDAQDNNEEDDIVTVTPRKNRLSGLKFNL